MGRRRARKAKTRPAMSSRAIKEGLKLTMRAVTVRRRQCEANLPALLKRRLPKSTSTGLQRNREASCGLMKVRWFFLGPRATDGSNSSHRSLESVKHCGSSIVSWRWFYYGVCSVYHIQGIMDQFARIRTLEGVVLPHAKEEMALKWVFQQDNDPKHTSW